MFNVIKNLFSGKKNPAPQEERVQSAVAAQMPNLVTAEEYHVDLDENVKPPKGAEISYMDAEALKFWNGRQTDYKIPNYYAESAFGRNVGPALRRALKNGYIVLGSVEKRIGLKTVPELKAVLAEHELKVSGKKAELVHRLIDNLSQQELERLFPVGIYEITPKGEHALEAYSIIFTSQKLGMCFPYYRLLKEKEAAPASDDIDIILRMMKQDINSAQKNRDTERYRTKCMEMANLLNGLAKPEEAIGYYCLSFFMFWYRNTFELRIDKIYAYEYDAKRIDECGKVCGYSLDQTLKIFQTSLSKNDPFGLCTSRNIAMAQQVFKKALSV